MRRSSLRLRLLGGAAVAVFAALALCWAGLSWLFHRHVEQREAVALTHVAERLAADVSLDAGGKPLIATLPADPRFDTLASGYYWQVTGPGGTAQSASLWDQNLTVPQVAADRWSRATAAGPFGHSLFMVARTVRPDPNARTVRIAVAEDDADLKRAMREFDRELAASLALLWLVLSLAGWLQVSLGLRPLAGVGEAIDRLRRSPAARLPADYPVEVAPLTDAINALADARENDLARARRRAADLAHSLKTPLAVLGAQSRRARAAGAADAADGLDRAIAAMAAALETELARSRAAAVRGAVAGEHAVIADVAEQVVAVLERTEAGEAIAFSVEIDPELRVPVGPSDLAEMLGALVENAVRHGRRQVRLSAAIDGALVRLSVEDDGPGLDPARAAAATERGRRLDERDAGHGLGLAIVQDLIEATEGEMTMGRSVLGGLLVTLSWARAV